MCNECTLDALPVNAAERPKREPNRAPRVRYTCYSCTGNSYKLSNVRQCPWCDNLCHLKCLNASLGCNTCCQEMIPGFGYRNYELFDNLNDNSTIFNPFSETSHCNMIGDRNSNEEENSAMWNEISNFLDKCTYKQSTQIQPSTSSELNVLYLNIRSLTKNVDTINDNIREYQKFDVICFNETSCKLDRLANGLDDLLIEGFHPPIIQEGAVQVG